MTFTYIYIYIYIVYVSFLLLFLLFSLQLIYTMKIKLDCMYEEKYVEQLSHNVWYLSYKIRNNEGIWKYKKKKQNTLMICYIHSNK